MDDFNRISWLKSNPKHFSLSYGDIPSYSDDYIQQIFSHPGNIFKNNTIYMDDFRNNFVEVRHGLRRSLYTPENYNRTIYCVGPSTVYGYGNEDAHTFTSQLQKILNIENYNIRVLNYGILGCYIQPLYLHILQLDLKKGDIVFFSTRNIRDKQLQLDYIKFLHLYCARRGAFFFYLFCPHVKDIKNPSPLEYIFATNTVDSYAQIIENEYPHIAVGKKKFISSFPYFRQEFDKLNIPFFDPTPAFNRPHDDGELFWDEGHLNPKGNKKLAESLYHFITDFLAKESSLPPVVINEEEYKALCDKCNHDAIRHLFILFQRQTDLESSVDAWVQSVKNEEFSNFSKIGAIVMNCNPFTKGHLYLIEEALQRVDGLYIFIVQEDKSDFSFAARLEMVQNGVAHLKGRVTVIPSGEFIISSFTFPGYFTKQKAVTPSDSTVDILLFGAMIAPKLNITCRFLGEEPNCIVTNSYNARMLFFFPPRGINVSIIKRKSLSSGKVISASAVRKALEQNNYSLLHAMLPSTTINYLISENIMRIDTESNTSSFPAPYFSTNNIPIIFSVDNRYVPVLSVALQSIIENSSEENNYDIIIISQDIDEEGQFSLTSQVKKYTNFSLRFIDISNFVKQYDISKWYYAKRFSPAAYYRLFIPLIFYQYHKLIYLDCDLILTVDIADLFAIDLQDTMLGVVHDFCFLHMRTMNSQIPWMDETKRYVIDVLQMKDERNYFNSGVLLCNIDKMKEANIFERFLQVAAINCNFAHDQNVLNGACEGDTLFLEGTWNVSAGIINHPRYVLLSQLEEYKQILLHAKILHYTSAYKPWKSFDVKFSSPWWRYARNTPFYEFFLNKCMTASISKQFPQLVQKKNKTPQKGKNPPPANAQKRNGNSGSVKRAIEGTYLKAESFLFGIFLNKDNYKRYKNSRKSFLTNGSKVSRLYYKILSVF